VTMIAVIVIAIVIEIVIATGVIVIVTDKSRILLNPALAGFFFKQLRQSYAGQTRGRDELVRPVPPPPRAMRRSPFGCRGGGGWR
jgi:hypothetical protein